MKQSNLVRLAVCLILGQSAMGQTTSILVAADARVQFFLNAIPVGQEYSYGFQNRLEFGSVRLGDPYEVYTGFAVRPLELGGPEPVRDEWGW